jgi:hypothetical protein
VEADADVCWVPEAEALADADVEADADVCCVPEAEALADADLPVDGVLVAGCVVEELPPAGDGVWVDWVAELEDVSGVGVNVDGTEEPPAVQAEAATASRTAPAARRPAVSQASRDGAAGVLSRMFMDPPRTRPLHPLIRRARPGDGELSSGVGCPPDKELPRNQASITGAGPRKGNEPRVERRARSGR